MAPSRHPCPAAPPACPSASGSWSAGPTRPLRRGTPPPPPPPPRARPPQPTAVMPTAAASPPRVPDRPPVLPPRRPAAPSAARAPRRPRRWGRKLRVLLLVLLLAVVGFGVWVDTSLNRVDALPADSAGTGSGTNWLIVGSDSRAGLTSEQEKELATGGDVGQRTDTIMLLHSGSSGPGPGEYPARLLRSHRRSRPQQAQRRLRLRRCAAAGQHGRGGHRSADRPLRRDRVRRLRRSRGRRRWGRAVRAAGDQGPEGGAEHQGGLPGARRRHRAGLRAHPGHSRLGLRPGGAPARVPVGAGQEGDLTRDPGEPAPGRPADVRGDGGHHRGPERPRVEPRRPRVRDARNLVAETASPPRCPWAPRRRSAASPWFSGTRTARPRCSPP